MATTTSSSSPVVAAVSIAVVSLLLMLVLVSVQVDGSETRLDSNPEKTTPLDSLKTLNNRLQKSLKERYVSLKPSEKLKILKKVDESTVKRAFAHEKSETGNLERIVRVLNPRVVDISKISLTTEDKHDENNYEEDQIHSDALDTEMRPPLPNTDPSMVPKIRGNRALKILESKRVVEESSSVSTSSTNSKPIKLPKLQSVSTNRPPVRVSVISKDYIDDDQQPAADKVDKDVKKNEKTLLNLDKYEETDDTNTKDKDVSAPSPPSIMDRMDDDRIMFTDNVKVESKMEYRTAKPEVVMHAEHSSSPASSAEIVEDPLLKYGGSGSSELTSSELNDALDELRRLEMETGNIHDKNAHNSLEMLYDFNLEPHPLEYPDHPEHPKSNEESDAHAHLHQNHHHSHLNSNSHHHQHHHHHNNNNQHANKHKNAPPPPESEMASPFKEILVPVPMGGTPGSSVLLNPQFVNRFPQHGLPPPPHHSHGHSHSHQRHPFPSRGNILKSPLLMRLKNHPRFRLQHRLPFRNGQQQGPPGPVQQQQQPPQPLPLVQNHHPHQEIKHGHDVEESGSVNVNVPAVASPSTIPEEMHVKEGDCLNLFSDGICLSIEHGIYPRNSMQLSLNDTSVNNLLTHELVSPSSDVWLEENRVLDASEYKSNPKYNRLATEGGFLCPSKVTYANVKKAKNSNGKWKWIVNTDEYKQTLRMEKCLSPGHACSYMQHQYRTSCTQVWGHHRLLSWDEDRGLHMDVFKIPTCCTCHVLGYYLPGGIKTSPAPPPPPPQSHHHHQGHHHGGRGKIMLPGPSSTARRRSDSLNPFASGRNARKMKIPTVPMPIPGRSTSLLTRRRSFVLQGGPLGIPDDKFLYPSNVQSQSGQTHQKSMQDSGSASVTATATETKDDDSDLKQLLAQYSSLRDRIAKRRLSSSALEKSSRKKRGRSLFGTGGSGQSQMNSQIHSSSTTNSTVILSKLLNMSKNKNKTSSTDPKLTRKLIHSLLKMKSTPKSTNNSSSSTKTKDADEMLAALLLSNNVNIGNRTLNAAKPSSKSIHAWIKLIQKSQQTKARNQNQLNNNNNRHHHQKTTTSVLVKTRGGSAKQSSKVVSTSMSPDKMLKKLVSVILKDKKKLISNEASKTSSSRQLVQNPSRSESKKANTTTNKTKVNYSYHPIMEYLNPDGGGNGQHGQSKKPAAGASS